ncbi:hypothetical protein ABZ173_07150 [Streptomyces rochei]|uniref:Uncharacterized protein n=1 Tax=Streptomyces vinaceusdrappus TaxID=67376 RepID=A0ABY6BXB3_9ACTN|nr:hypothetical protein [Streptomyces vinaceusdrappus]UXI80182.1 hypothetical protein N6Q81_20235 [Streptomyces vinaceusdrappus]
MTTPPGSRVGPPADYRLLLPEGWFRLDIDPERRERSVDALVNRRFEGMDNVPHIKRQLRQDLLAQATAAFREGGIELYLSLQQAGPLTIPASLLVTFLPASPSTTTANLDDIAMRLASDGQAEVEVVELAAGTAVRVRRATGGPDQAPPVGLPGKAEEALPSLTLDYQLSVPGTEAHLLMTFSTPLVQIADAMVELFDAVAGSLTWMGGDGNGD